MGAMDMNIDLLIYRISSGKLFFSYNNESLTLLSPSVELRYEAEMLYDEIIEDHLYDNWIRKEDVHPILKRMDMWNESDEKFTKQLEKTIENSKIALYQNRDMSKKVSSIRKDLMNQKNSLVKLLERKHYLDHITLEEYAQNRKYEFILAQCLYYRNKSRKFIPNIDEYNIVNLQSLVSKINNYSISTEMYKKIAISDQWRKIWNSGKSNIFGGKSSTEFSEEQLNLVNISMMYDRIYENPECPPESVIQDSDMLDGWMLDQKKKLEDQKKKDSAGNLADKHKNAKEIFIVTDQEEALDVIGMNDTEARSIIRNRNALINQSSDLVNVGSLPDIQMDIIRQRNNRI